MDDDSALLKQFISTRDEQAFGALVRRYVDLVYSAARRQVRDDAAAQDVTQQVFVLLAEKANTIRDSQAIAGWLLVTTRFVALNSIRTESRRRRHEREAAVMHEKRRAENEPAWEQVGPMLDETVARLKTEDRDALALRYFQGRSVADVAATMGVSQEAAQKRLSRAIERLRELFARRGVTTSADALSSLLMANALVIAPAALGSAVAGAALTAGAAGAGACTTGTGKAAVIFVTAAKGKLLATCAAGAILIGITGAMAYQHLAAPGTRTRQVRVEFAPAPQPSPNQPGEWRASFDRLYRLKPGENAKFVPKPFIPERLEFYRSTMPREQVRAIPEGPDGWLLSDDGEKLRWRRCLFGRPDVAWVFEVVLGAAKCDIETSQAILNTLVEGDWVVREGATPEQKVAAVESALTSALARRFQVGRVTLEREALVVRGRYGFNPLVPPAPPPQTATTWPVQYDLIHVYRGTFDAARRTGTRGGTIVTVFQEVAANLRMPLVIELHDTDTSRPVQWRLHPSAATKGDAKPPAQAIDEIVTDLAAQTSLEIKRETRPVSLWQIRRAQ